MTRVLQLFLFTHIVVFPFSAIVRLNPSEGSTAIATLTMDGFILITFSAQSRIEVVDTCRMLMPLIKLVKL